MRSRMGTGIVVKQQYSFWRSSRRFDHIAGFNSFTSMSLYWALVTVWPFSWKCTNIGPVTSQKMVSMTFPAEACVLNFCWPEMTGVSTASIVSYSLVHNGTPRTRLLSLSDGEKHLLHEHDGPNAPDKLSAMHTCDHQTTALGPICYTLSYTPRSLWTILYAEPWLMLNAAAISSTVTCL